MENSPHKVLSCAYPNAITPHAQAMYALCNFDWETAATFPAWPLIAGFILNEL